MKKFLTVVCLMGSLTACAQDISLPAPDFSQPTLSMMETLKTRHSVRSYADRDLSIQQISNVCWAACGVNREDGGITAPSCMGWKAIRLYVFTKTAVYEYIAAENVLAKKADGDHRALVAGGQNFVLEAPVSFVMAADFKKFGSHDEGSVRMTCVDAGNVSENINLYCQSAGLATVPRASMDSKGIAELLGLGTEIVPVMNNPVGYAK